MAYTLSKFMPRYIIIGCSGAGKSTLARKIAEICALPYHDTDALYWQKGWLLSSDEEVIDALPLDSEHWVIDGNFVGHREAVWGRATSIIWLDLPTRIIMSRVIRRNLGWCFRRKPTWSGNRMPLRIALCGIVHAWKRFPQIRNNYPTYFDDFYSATVHRIQDDAGILTFLDSITSKTENRVPVTDC